MTRAIPHWAMRAAGPADRAAVQEARGRALLHVVWPEREALRAWAAHQGWPTPFFGVEEAFLSRMLETQESFELAVREAVVVLRVPLNDVSVDADRLGAFDAMYAARDAQGDPSEWGSLVESLREIRRAMESGVVIHVGGVAPIRTWGAFHAWANGRYPALEDGSDAWIGDDDA